MEELDMIKRTFKSLSGGFSLLELLLVIVIVGFMAMAGLWAFRNQIERGNDARRKDDLVKIRIAFEDYYNDNNCYPPVTVMDSGSDCGGPGLSPYLRSVLCDPVTQAPYGYQPVVDAYGNPCKGYRMLTRLHDTTDTDITRVGCSPVTGCGTCIQYNYGISSGVPVVCP